jgi:hypothetical protein
MMGLFVLIAFWGIAIRLWILDGAKIPLIFMGGWLIGLFVFSGLGLNPYLFISFEAVLAVALLVIEKYNKAF